MASWKHRRRSLAVFLVLLASAVEVAAEASRKEVEALKQIYASFGKPIALLDWTGQHPCRDSWSGVVCDNSHPQHVVGLLLGSMRLYGDIPAAIFKLKYIRTLDLSTNGISGSIPEWLGHLSSLQTLELEHNHLTGAIPKSLAHLTKLTMPSLSGSSVVVTATRVQLSMLGAYDGQGAAVRSKFQYLCTLRPAKLHLTIFTPAACQPNTGASVLSPVLNSACWMQMTVLSRQAGSVILDLALLPVAGPFFSAEDVSTLRKQLLALNGTLVHPQLGPYIILSITDPWQTGVTSKRRSVPLIYIIPIVLSAAALVALAIALIVYREMRLGSIRKSTTIMGPYDMSHPFQQLPSRPNSFDGNEAPAPRKDDDRNSDPPLPVETVPEETVLSVKVLQVPYEELYMSSGGFNEGHRISSGEGSAVYRGTLANGQDVAIKHLRGRSGQGLTSQFRAEVEVLSKAQHLNLVNFIGYCTERNEQLIVTQFAPNGTLREHLDFSAGKKGLSWEARICVALGAARGMEYLHDSAPVPILHGDLKSRNILLDEKWRAKVSSFGVARPATPAAGARSSSIAGVLGNSGYQAPEQANMGLTTIKSDVFSFGVVLLELLTGRKSIDHSRPEGQESLVLWAVPLLQKAASEADKIVDPALRGRYPVHGMEQLARLAWACLQAQPASRPDMPAVVDVLVQLMPEHRKLQEQST
eukprot:SM000004S15133  [mRNA]  locus=s4:1477965:1483316:+ [translate_table: standard]